MGGPKIGAILVKLSVTLRALANVPSLSRKLETTSESNKRQVPSFLLLSLSSFLTSFHSSFLSLSSFLKFLLPFSFPLFFLLFPFSYSFFLSFFSSFLLNFPTSLPFFLFPLSSLSPLFLFPFLPFPTFPLHFPFSFCLSFFSFNFSFPFHSFPQKLHNLNSYSKEMMRSVHGAALH